jgi:ABC-type phosphate transport system substrate-binding protein
MLRSLCSLLIVYFCVSASVAHAEAFVVIANTATPVSAISKSELKEIYSGERVFWNSAKRIRPARLPDDQSVTGEFLQSILFKTPTQFVQFWRHKLFSGKGLPPKIVDDSDKMISYIADTEGSVGYLPSDKKINNQKIKILELKD